MKMKRIFAFMLAVVMCLSVLAGCSIKPSSSDTPSGEVSGEVSDETSKETNNVATKEDGQKDDGQKDDGQKDDGKKDDDKKDDKDDDKNDTRKPGRDQELELVPVPQASTNFVKGVTDAKSTFAGKTIQFYAAETWGHDSDNKKILYPQLAKDYGLRVIVKPSVIYRDVLQNIQEIKARKQIDLIGVGHEKLPSVYAIMQPLNNKINLDKAPEGLNKSLMEDTMKGNDIMYLPQYGSEGIVYNVNNIKQAGKEEPFDLQVKGQWTWDKFAEYVKFFTEDNDKNGQPEKWGFGSWERTLHEFALTNNTGYYTYNADGTVTSNITTDAVVQSMNFVKELHGKNKAFYFFKGLGNYPEFYTDESVTMLKMGAPHNPKDLQYGMVAMPKGPNPGSENIVTTQGTGYGLPATMVKKQNEKAALLLQAYMLDYRVDQVKRGWEVIYGANPRWEEQFDVVYGGKTPTKILILYGVGSIESKIGIIEQAMKDDSKSMEQTVQSLKNIFENEARKVYTIGS